MISRSFGMHFSRRTYTTILLFVFFVLGVTPETTDAILCPESNGFIQFHGQEGELAIDNLPSATDPLSGNLSLFVNAALDDWTPPSFNQAIFGSSKAIIQLLAMSNGSLRFVLKLDENTIKAKSEPHNFEPGSRHWIRINYDTSVGEVVFFHSEANCGDPNGIANWIKLGDPVATGGTAPIKSISYFVLGRRKAGDEKYALSNAKIYGVKLAHDGTGALTEGVFSSWSGTNDWKLSGGLEITPSTNIPTAAPSPNITSPAPTLSSSLEEPPSPPSSQDKHNNLLVILTDQQRYDTLRFVQEERGVPEKARIRTPNLDRIAREGAYFRNAYTHCAVCGPARAGFMFGRTIENTGIRTNNMAKDENLPGSDAEFKLSNIMTYDEILVKDHGYVAEYYGKWHLPNSKGFIYNNDVRRGSGALNWFGKYYEDGSKRLALGMTEWYRRWLSNQENSTLASKQKEIGDQRNTFSTYFYDPDPLDTRFGLEEDVGWDGVKQPDQHGMNRLDDDLSITAHQAAETIEALERLAAGDAPFSLHLSLHSPHAPMIPTRRYYEAYSPDDMIVPESLVDDLSNSAYMNDRLPDGYDDPAKVQRWTANYFGLITEIDEWIGRLLDKMDELGIADNTLLAFSSDHGEMLGAHAMREKNNFYEESSRVPLLLRMPGTIPPGIIVDDPVSHLDLHSTFLDYSIGSIGRSGYETDGMSLRNYVEGGTESRDAFVVTQWNSTDIINGYRPSRDPAFMIRKGPWKLILSCLGSDHQPDMLFNLDDDPAEIKNLLGSNGDTASESVIGKAEHLKAMLFKYLVDGNHPAAPAVQQRRAWREPPSWMGASSIAFRDLLADGTRTEYLYLGTKVGEAVSVSVVGNDGHFSLRLDSQYLHENAGFALVEVRFAKIYKALPQENSTLIVKIGTRAEEAVNLSPPMRTAGPTNVIASVDESFADTLQFTASTSNNSPTIAPESPPTSHPTTSLAPSSDPTELPPCTTDLPSQLLPGVKLFSDLMPRFICSPNGQYRFGLTLDGNLSVWYGGEVIWSANTCCKGSGTYLNMQRDGNMVVYTYNEGDDSEDTFETSIYSSETYDNANAFLTLDNDGRVRIRSADDPNKILWENNANLFSARNA